MVIWDFLGYGLITKCVSWMNPPTCEVEGSYAVHEINVEGDYALGVFISNF
jgi:hypothetical protein